MRHLKQRNYVKVSAGSYKWIPVDHHTPSFNVSYAAFHNGTGQVSANIEGTLDDVFTIASCKVFFVVTANASSGLVADGNLIQPLAALRYTVTEVSGSANVSFSVLLGGI
jgi:hypothetical protein